MEDVCCCRQTQAPRCGGSIASLREGVGSQEKGQRAPEATLGEQDDRSAGKLSLATTKNVSTRVGIIRMCVVKSSLLFWTSVYRFRGYVGVSVRGV